MKNVFYDVFEGKIIDFRNNIDFQDFFDLEKERKLGLVEKENVKCNNGMNV